MDFRKLFKLILLFNLLAISLPAHSDQLRIKYQFKIDDSGTCLDGNRCQPWTGDLFSLTKELFPVVPVKLSRVLIPVEQQVTKVEFIPGPSSLLAFSPKIAVQEKHMCGPNYPRTVPAYLEGVFPLKWTGESHINKFRGYQIVETQIFPLRVVEQGQVILIKEGELIVTTQAYSSPQSSEFLRGLVRDQKEAMLLTDNKWPTIITPQEAAIGYLIIGPRDIVGTKGSTPLAPIITEKEARGLKVEIAHLETVSPQKKPEEIRAFIKSKYQKSNIDYVLLVGDKDRFPWKKFQSGMNDDGDPVPSDQYYACLDGDFSEISAYDWSCEVSVGRLGVRNKADLENWTKKAVRLNQIIAQGKTNQIFLFGEALDAGTMAGRLLDMLIGKYPNSDEQESSMATVGFPATLKFQKLYDEQGEAEHSGEEFLTLLKEGDYHVVNHLGHANATYLFRLFFADLDSLPSRPSFHYTQGCYANDPDEDNWTINSVRRPDIGPVAMIANTRYGWYEPGASAEGTSALLNRAFWHMRFGMGIKNLGPMNHKAKELLMGAQGTDNMRYTALESTLIGDPELDLKIK